MIFYKIRLILIKFNIKELYIIICNFNILINDFLYIKLNYS